MRLIGLAVILAPYLILAPYAAEGQPAGKTARVGVLWFGASPRPAERARSEFAAAMRERGWVEGQNLAILHLFSESTDQLHAFAAELEQLRFDVIVASSGGMADIARREARNTPIVIHASGFDLVRRGLVANLARPGGNITGSQNLQSDTHGKRLQLLRECVPKLSRVAFLRESVTLTDVEAEARQEREYVDTAGPLGLEVHVFRAARPEDFPALFREMARKGTRGVSVTATPFMFVHRTQIADLAAKHRIATIHMHSAYVDAGGLMSYGSKDSAKTSWRRTASYVDRILKGAKPGDLPIEQPTEFELVINLKTAKALGLTIPQPVLAHADDLIQ